MVQFPTGRAGHTTITSIFLGCNQKLDLRFPIGAPRPRLQQALLACRKAALGLWPLHAGEPAPACSKPCTPRGSEGNTIHPAAQTRNFPSLSPPHLKSCQLLLPAERLWHLASPRGIKGSRSGRHYGLP